jgi:hypothetical protein
MNERKYIYIIPILTSVLFLASVAAVITNGITYSDSTVRNFNISSLDAGEYESYLVTIPSSMSRARLDISMAITPAGISGTAAVNIYIMASEPPSELSDSAALLASSYFDQERISSAEGVENRAILYLNDDYEQIYLIVSNPSLSDLDNVYVNINIDDESSFSQAGQVVKIIAIVLSSILTFVFVVLSVYFWVEALGYEYYEPKVLTLNLERRLSQFVNKTQTWEQFLLSASLVLLPFGLADWLINELDSPIPYLVILIVIVVYFSYNNRNRIYDAIRTILKQQREMSLTRLSELIDRDEKNTKSSLMDMIIYENFPAKINFDTHIVTYHPEGLSPEDRTMEPTEPKSYVTQESKFAVSREEVTAGKESGSEIEPTRPLPECAYCGETAITHEAKFCHACGASMTSAK